MVGNSIISAPRSSRGSNPPACSLVTSTLCPNIGFFSYHMSVFLNFTTSPTTITAGGFISFSFTMSAMSLRVPVMVFWSGLVPHLITATGVSGLLPFSISFFTRTSIFFTAIKKIRVPAPVASFAQSIADSSFVMSS